MSKQKRRVLDRIDYKILRRLQGNARLTNADLARSVNLSPTPCLERVRRLEADGYILDYVTLLNPQKLGAGVISFIQVSLDRTNADVFERFKEQVSACPEVMECHMVAGGFDYLLKVRTRSMLEYRDFLGQTLARMSDIKQTHTYVVMEEVKATHAIAV
ncbi:MAG: Lrp/AsnC ligand binding domain-containing protein [Gammaproteobacteria bacterium]|nr:Lrp/AsnC ligand binding domain-containing protein [Gammaproteobacteria bacterium]MBT8075953.1 Lrp/AsnC ligand binding domain-containing protein [Gammaproteobacteria bacterium]NNK98017.1 winged helix-turn-helix transcriptional regulator [Xanthomonadales bacterium]